MNLAPIIARLSDECTVLKLVGGALEFEQALAGLTTMPAAFVLPARDAAQRSPFGNQIVEQRVDSEFAVILAVRNLGFGASGAAAVESLEPVRVAVRDALLAWQPDSPTNDMDGCEFGSGALLPGSFRDQVLWWQDTYLTAYTIRSTP